MHLSILGHDLTLSVHDRVSQVSAISDWVLLGIAAEGQPHLVVQRQLGVPFEQFSTQVLIVVQVYCPLHRILTHVGEVLWQTHHLSTFLGTLFDQSRASLKVLLNVVPSAELDDSHDRAEVILLGR